MRKTHTEYGTYMGSEMSDHNIDSMDNSEKTMLIEKLRIIRYIT